MGNLRKGRTLRKTSTLWELHLRCNDFGKLRIKAILSEAGVPCRFSGVSFVYDTEDALAAIHKHRKAAGQKRRTDPMEIIRRRVESEEREAERADREGKRRKRGCLESWESHLKSISSSISKNWKC